MKNFRARKSVDEETIEAMAAAWLAQRDEGLEPDEAEEFARWQRADPRHAAAVARLDATWHTLQSLREFRPEARRHPDRDLLAHPRGGRAGSLPAWLAAGAVAALAVILWWPRLRPAERPEPATAHTYATTIDGYQRVTLEDGSLVELNASSEVRVEYLAAERRLQLLRGEAHFTVVKNQARPFLVSAGAVAVRAVGTAFNVRLAEPEHRIEVLVTEGRVKVEPHGGPAPAESPLITAGQRAFIPAAGTAAAPRDPAGAMTVERLSPESIRDILAWQGPRLVFVDTALKEVVEQFNRRNQVQIALGDEDLGTLTIGGSFRTENVEAFVRLMTSGNEIVAERPDSGHIVLRRAR